MAASSATRERGFTLIEVLIALVISAGVLGAFFPLVSQANLGALRAEDRMAVLLRADAKLIEVADGAPRIVRAESGRWADGSRWSLTVDLEETGRTHRLFKFALSVSRDGHPVTTLQTLRLERGSARP